MKKKLLVVLSGGMDSAVALALVLRNGDTVVDTITFNYGSKHNEVENARAKMIADFYGVSNTLVALPFVNELFKSDLLLSGGEVPEGHYEAESMKRTVVPFRNGIMLAIATGYAESIGVEGVVLGNHSGDHAIYPDCREEFTVAMGAAMQQGTVEDMALITPFGEADKTAVATIGDQMGVPWAMTWSCYKGGDFHCGVCGTCTERKEALKLAGVKDPTAYLAE